LGGQYREAVESQRQALDINKSLLAENPKNMLARSEIGDGYNYIGEVLEKTRDTNGALESYRQAAAVREEMTNADPNDAQFRQAVAESYQTIGRVSTILAAESHASRAARISQLKDARSWYQRSLDIWKELNSSGKLSAVDAENIAAIESELGKCCKQ
ncbi:MAG: tetratricopeptide repeat protein, partial [Pyrinomonadaceae bacterium]